MMRQYDSLNVPTTDAQLLMARLQWATKLLCNRARVGTELLRLRGDPSTLEACLVELAALRATVRELRESAPGQRLGFEGFYEMGDDLRTYICAVLAHHHSDLALAPEADTDLLPELDGWALGERDLEEWVGSS